MSQGRWRGKAVTIIPFTFWGLDPDARGEFSTPVLNHGHGTRSPDCLDNSKHHDCQVTLGEIDEAERRDAQKSN